jgi:hypothetical protein
VSFSAVGNVLSALLTTRAVLFVLGLATGGMLTVWSEPYRSAMTALVEVWQGVVGWVIGG